MPALLMVMYSLAILLPSPYLVRLMHRGKLWEVQPWIFGFEGYLDVECIERQIFGARLGRLHWSPFGSPLSRHYINEHGEYVGVDPTIDPETRALVDRGSTVRPGDQRVSISH